MRPRSANVGRRLTIRALAPVMLATLAAPCHAGTSSPIGFGGLAFYVIGLILLIAIGARSRFARFAAYAWFVTPLVFLLITEETDRRARTQASARVKAATDAEKVAKEPVDDASTTTPPQARR